jgi:hypothetical protein
MWNYSGQLNVTFAGNAGCFKYSVKLVFQMLLCGECYEHVYSQRHTQTFQLLRCCEALFETPLLH